jgi:CcmD family protein
MQFLEYMATAYSVIWGAVLFYFISLSRKEKEIWEEIHDLRRRLSNGEESARRPDNP